MYTIIGGGPAGLHSAYQLAREGVKTTIYEEHKEIGKPIQCTGIVTNDLLKHVKPDNEVVINKIQRAIIHSPDNIAELKLKELVIDRAAFDKQLAKMAESEGVDLRLNKKVNTIKETNSGFELTVNNRKEVHKKLIGADGPLSNLKKLINPRQKTSYLTGKQARVKGNFDSETYHVFFGPDYEDFFGWIVPENRNTARVGVASEKNTSTNFKRLMNRNELHNTRIIEYNAGIIPVYNPKLKTHYKKAFLIGDAATQVKATTGGGIIPGLKASKCLTESITKGKDYHRLWKKKIGFELLLHQKIRKSLNTFDSRDYNNMVDILKNSTKILEKHSRDNLRQMLVPLMLKNPSLVRFIKNIRL